MTDLRDRLQAAVGDAYRVERELGRGGMATVWLAQDVKHDRPVALKVLSPEIAAALGPERFLREIQIAARLAHPHILPLHDSGLATAEFLYYTMPYVEGESLRDRLDREKQLPLDDALQIAREVADALSYAHSRDVVHRDIKPENILLQAGHAVVADFGIARAITAAGGDQLTATGVTVGTPSYMSPEQAAGSQDLDGRSDLYSLGCVLYEMLAGRPPFVGPTVESVVHQHLTAEAPAITSLRPAVPAAVAAALARSLSKTPADRFNPVALFGEALRGASTGVGFQPTARRPLRRRPLVLAAVAIGLALGAAALARLLAPKDGGALDPDLLAVAPFDAVTTAVEEYREGLMTILSRTLDGAGPIRTISPTVVVRRWRGRSDPTSAAALGQATGAGLVVFGQAVSAGADSVVLTATVYDVNRAHAVGEVEVRDERERIDRVADTLAVRVLRELGRTRPVGAVRFAALGSTSLPAIKLFLRAEQFYRRGQWDSTVAYAQRAVAVDSNFALALRHAASAVGWSAGGGENTSMHLRAGATSRGLAPRESLLVKLDSLWGALQEGTSPPWPLLRRLGSTTEEAVARYPEDPETWYMKGEVAVHYGVEVEPRLSPRAAFDAFARAIALDSAFGPAFEHLVALAFRLEPDLGREYANRFLRLDPQIAPALRASLDLLDHPHPSAAAAAFLDTATGAQLEAVVDLDMLAGAADSGEAQIAVARARANSRDAPDWTRLELASSLARRGHLREAAQQLWTVPRRPSGAFWDVLHLGGLPPDSAARWLESLLRDSVDALGGLPWWVVHGDTAAMFRLARLAEAKRRSAVPGSVPADVWTYVRASVEPYVALAHHDTTRALDLLANLPDSLCRWCITNRLTHVLLLSAQRRDREAATLLDEPLIERPNARDVIWTLERGRVNERLGNRHKAVESYAFVAAMWRHADAELQPFVEEARAGLERLRGETKP